MKVNKKNPVADKACHRECVAIQTAIKIFFSEYPSYKMIKYLHGKCGFVTEGKCAYFHPAKYLVTDLHVVHVPGKKIRALVDTGSGVTVIHGKLAQFTRKLKKSLQFVSGATLAEVQPTGKTTIDVRIDENTTISITGLVMDMDDFGILLGNDFFLKYKVKIRIFKKKMEILKDQTPLEIPIKFRSSRGQIFQVNDPDPGGYMPLKISALLNGRKTEIAIDTGASVTIVSEDFVSSENERGTKEQIEEPDETVVDFGEQMDVDISVEGTTFSTVALIARFDLGDSLITGYTFNRRYVELIDFEHRMVTLKLSDDDSRVETEALIAKGA